jgi:RHS repeat-associated protein
VEQVGLTTGTVNYLIGDALGSVRGIINAAGTLAATTYYDAWGNPEVSAGLTSYTPFGFAGAYTDPTGLIYLIGRYYEPSTGQFLSVDPDFSETSQSYGYASDDPVNVTDPTGQDSIYEVALRRNCNKTQCAWGRRNCSGNRCSINWWITFRRQFRYAFFTKLSWQLYIDNWPVDGGSYSHAEYGYYWFHSSWGSPNKDKARGYYECWWVLSCYTRPTSSIELTVESPFTGINGDQGIYYGAVGWN